MMQNSSNKFRGITKTRNLIMQRINDSQILKRLIYYNSNDPLGEFGIDLEGNTIEQSDLDIDFTTNGEHKRIHSNFMKKILEKYETHIFVRRLESNLEDQVRGVNTIVIDIIVPTEYSELDEGNDREGLICTTICSLIDGETINSLGGVKVAHVKESMLEQNNKEFNCLTMFIEVPTSNSK